MKNIISCIFSKNIYNKPFEECLSIVDINLSELENVSITKINSDVVQFIHLCFHWLYFPEPYLKKNHCLIQYFEDSYHF